MSALHITNGDHAGDKLRPIVDGPVAIACDVLHEGPCPPIEGDAWYEVRAQFLASSRHAASDVKASLAAGDRAIADARDVVLWFEHDLYDQLLLIRMLDLIARLKPRATGERLRVSLICIDRFPGIERFIGLGQLTPEQLASLIGTGTPVTAGHSAVASGAWRAFRSSDPRELLEVADSTALPFLRPALRRFLAEYPATANGLTRTEELALRALGAGETTAGALFGATQADEAAPFMGDTTFFEILQRLATARVPLVTLDGAAHGGDLRPARVAITGAGREVVAGRADHVHLNGIDLWRGGVHLHGSDDSPWRWDARRETLVS